MPADGMRRNRLSKGKRLWSRPLLRVRYQNGSEFIVTFQQGASGYTGTSDVMIANGPPAGTVNFGTWALVTASRSTGTHVATGLLRWDVSSLPRWATVRGVSLDLYLQGSWNTPFDLRELTGPFYEYQSTWLTVDGTVPWNLPGATGPSDRSSVVSGVLLPAGRTGKVLFPLDVASWSVVEAWASGQPNYGWVLAAANVDGYMTLSSREASPASNRPALVVDYVEGALSLAGPASTQVSVVSGPYTVTRAALGGVPLGAGLTAVSVTISATSGEAQFATNPGGPFSPTLVLSLGAGQTVSSGFYLESDVEGTVSISAEAGQGWDPTGQTVTITP